MTVVGVCDCREVEHPPLESDINARSYVEHVAKRCMCCFIQAIMVHVLGRKSSPEMPRRIQSSVGCLGSFFEGLCKFAHYSKFEECGRLRNRDLLSSANVMCVLSFDRDEDHIAAGGVSKKIKIFDLNAISSDSVDIQYPVVEMSNKSKLSCVK
ncbi:Protein SUPPRESSOR OF PHYA-105 1 [Glycine soja]|nr:Protein SUPPRESSOR OF PHYA-105 1 [Glycine soja]